MIKVSTRLHVSSSPGLFFIAPPYLVATQHAYALCHISARSVSLAPELVKTPLPIYYEPFYQMHDATLIIPNLLYVTPHLFNVVTKPTLLSHIYCVMTSRHCFTLLHLRSS